MKFKNININNSNINMSFKGGSKGGAAPALFNNPGYKSTNTIQFRGQDKPQSSALG
jgi:hypothetical protein